MSYTMDFYRCNKCGHKIIRGEIPENFRCPACQKETTFTTIEKVALVGKWQSSPEYWASVTFKGELVATFSFDRIQKLNGRINFWRQGVIACVLYGFTIIGETTLE